MTPILRVSPHPPSWGLSQALQRLSQGSVGLAASEGRGLHGDPCPRPHLPTLGKCSPWARGTRPTLQTLIRWSRLSVWAQGRPTGPECPFAEGAWLPLTGQGPWRARLACRGLSGFLKGWCRCGLWPVAGGLDNGPQPPLGHPSWQRLPQPSARHSAHGPRGAACKWPGSETILSAVAQGPLVDTDLCSRHPCLSQLLLEVPCALPAQGRGPPDRDAQDAFWMGEGQNLLGGPWLRAVS